MAETLLCPFDVTTDPNDGHFTRTPSLFAFQDVIEPLTSANPALWPTRQYIEVQGSSKTGANETLFEVDLGVLSKGTRDLIVLPQPMGAGCSVVNKATKLVPARPPKVIGGQLNYNADDVSRPIINPFETKSNWWIESPTRWALHQLLKLFRVPEAAAVAFGVFPVMDDFNRADGALTTPWVGAMYSGDTTLTIATNSIHRASGNASAWYQRPYCFAHNGEVGATVGGKTDTQFHRLYWVINPGGASLSGYQLKLNPIASTANDQQILIRIDSTVDTVLNTNVTEFLDTNVCGMRNILGALTSFANGNVRATATDTTYLQCNGYYGARLAGSTVPTWDDIKFGSMEARQ